MKKVSNNKLFVRSNFVRYKSHNTNSIWDQCKSNNVSHYPQHKFTTTRFVLSILLMSTPFLRASSWTPGTVTILSQSRLRVCMHPMVVQIRMHPMVRMRRNVLAIVGSSRREFKPKLLKRGASIRNHPSYSEWPWQFRANIFEKTESLSQRCVCVGCQLSSALALRLRC